MKHVGFRLDASSAIGLGHLKRCLALAQALQGTAKAHFVLRRSDVDAAALVHAAGHACTLLAPDADDAAQSAQALITAQLIVVDHYGLDTLWHRTVRGLTGAAIAVIDDLADRPLACDLLIDANPADDHARKYQAVLPAGVPICGGPAFALLDTTYRECHPRVPASLVQHIGIFMGGTDPGAHSTWVLDVLRRQVGWTGAVTIASTSANASLAALQDAVNADGNAQLLLDQPNLAHFHSRCDLQIGAGGGALWERCCLGVPTVALICADNQLQSVPWAAAQGVVRGLEARTRSTEQGTALAESVTMLIGDHAVRLALHGRGRALVDGHGAERVAQRLLQLAA